MSNTRYVYAGAYNVTELDYEPKDYIGTLDWFNIARCARERMTERCGNIHEWRGERRSFYTAIQKMDADTKVLLD
jgi:hypothetical protein